ncbi:transmembrane protein 209 [Diorhabda carinulata]|uniref:transmembrane protein 209 n=1 Tax=Diorhabda carinulata TaxID=1163345 RepID=UPI0025A301B1|nr:transmembrane protein 209 [Diorhabda carinulata]
MNVSLSNNRFNNSQILERSLTINKIKRSMKQEVIWGTLNFAILSIILYDLNESCPSNASYFRYGEYILVICLTINLFYYLIKIIKVSLTYPEPLIINEAQKKLLGVKDSDPNYKVIQTPVKNGTPQNSSTPFNITLSRNISQYENDSLNYSMSSPSWTYIKGTSDLNSSKFSPKRSPVTQQTPVKSSFRDVSSMELIEDEDSLNKYLKEHEENEKANKLTSKQEHSSNLLSSFWSHPVTQTAKDVSEFLKKCQYQLSTQSPNKISGSPNLKSDDKSSSPAQVSALEVWTRINVDSVALTQWNENIRKWISQTILERLVTEFDRVTAALDKHGLSDVKIGAVGLDRLRKTAQTASVAQFIPSLPALIPFLEVTSNQEYLERRIRDLTKGGCMSEFKWNSGGRYGGKEWDESLPTDCAVIMHLLASYLDTQLMPLPNMPDTKAFSGHHYLKITDKVPVLTGNSLFIQEVSEKPPHYRVVVAGKTYEMVKGYNNLFHSILFFIYHVNKMEHGMLGRVNLGRAGVNILWVIDQ